MYDDGEELAMQVAEVPWGCARLALVAVVVGLALTAALIAAAMWAR